MVEVSRVGGGATGRPVPDDASGRAGFRRSIHAAGGPAVPGVHVVVARREARRTPVAVGAHALSLYTLPDPDALLDDLTQEGFDASDGRMPYFATLWPSALALAQHVLTSPGAWVGRRVLDLGCGLGLVGLAALARGASVTFLDWEPDAVALAVASAWAEGHGAVEGVVADWRSPPLLPVFDTVLAADVLYEERNGPAVAAFLAAHLPAPPAEGEALVVDPGRRHAAAFPDDLAACGLVVVETRALPPAGEAQTPALFRIARRGPNGAPA